MVHGADKHDGRVGFWMDLIEGHTLEERVSHGRLSAGEALLGQELARSRGIASSESRVAELTRDYEVNRDLYQDLLRREGGSWRFARRSLTFTTA